MFRVEFVYLHPETATAADATDFSNLDTSAPDLAAVGFAAYEALYDDGRPIRLVFQAWRDVLTAGAAIDSAAIATARATACAQMGIAEPAWTLRAADTEFVTPGI